MATQSAIIWPKHVHKRSFRNACETKTDFRAFACSSYPAPPTTSCPTSASQKTSPARKSGRCSPTSQSGSHITRTAAKSRNPTPVRESCYSSAALANPFSLRPGPFLHKSDVFKFSTFGFPPLTCTVEESEAPESNGRAGRIAWSSKTPDGMEIYHAWLVEDLEEQRVRILTQESQIGKVFKEWEEQKPNKMLLGHQDWLDGLVTAAKGMQIQDTNLEAINFPVRK